MIFCANESWHFIFSERTYAVRSVLQVEPSIQGQEVTNLVNISNSGSVNLNQQTILYKTRTNILTLIETLNLNIGIKDINDEFLKINSDSFKLEIKEIKSGERVQLNLTLEKDYFNLSDLNKNPILSNIPYDKTYEDEEISIFIKDNSLDKTKEYQIFYRQKEDLVNSYKSRLSVSNIESNRGFYSPGGGLMMVSFITADTERGLRIVDEANKIFIDKGLKNKSEKASLAIEFIDERLSNMEDLLVLEKERLNQFQMRNITVDVDLEIKEVLQSLTNIQEKLTVLELEEAKTRTSYTAENPLYSNILSQKNVLIEEKTLIEEKIKEMPIANQEYIDLYRNLEVTQGLYNELLNKKLNYSILEASTLGNVRVIDDAYVSSRVSPRLSRGLIFLFFAGIFSCLLALIRGLYFSPLTNPAELSDSGINEPLVGIMPSSQDFETDKNFIQSLESLVVNTRLLAKDKGTEGKSKIILITSASASNGKSLTSRMLARGLADLGHKTLLIDGDLKQGDQHKAFKIKTITQDEILKIIELKDLESYFIQDDLCVLPRLSRLKSSFKWLDSSVFQNFLENVALPNFEYIIVDTAPLLSVSDTSLLINISDVNFMVVRHDLTRINEVKQSIDIVNQLGSAFDGFIYNDYQRPSGYYGYYQYYGNYSYQYYADKYLYTSYDYKNE